MIIERRRAPVQRIAVTNSIAFLKAMVQENGKLRFGPMAGARMSTPPACLKTNFSSDSFEFHKIGSATFSYCRKIEMS
jgi:hypothetical protein